MTSVAIPRPITPTDARFDLVGPLVQAMFIGTDDLRLHRVELSTNLVELSAMIDERGFDRANIRQNRFKRFIQQFVGYVIGDAAQPPIFPSTPRRYLFAATASCSSRRRVFS